MAARAQPTEPAPGPRLARLLALVAAARARAVRTVLVAIAMAALSLVAARGLRVDTNLEALLADDDPAVAALRELRARKGSTDYLYLAARSRDPAALERLVRDMAARARTWPEVEEVVTGRDFTPLRDHALYFLEVDQLQELLDELVAERRRAIARKLAAGVGDGDVDLAQVVVGDDWDADPSEWAEPEPEAAPGAAPAPSPDDAHRDLRALLREHRASLLQAGALPPEDLALLWPEDDAQGRMPFPARVVKPFVSKDGDIRLVRVRFARPATDLAWAREVAARARALFDELDPTSYAPDMLVKIGGPYMASREANAIIRDLRRATTLSAVLVVSVLIAGFRRVRAVALVLVPITLSTAVTLACARLLLGQLNVLTAFLFAVLLGIGVDFAVHLYAMRERLGRAPRWGQVLAGHLRPLTWSMLTTACSFLVLTLARFQGFREFGLIAAVGVAVSFAVSIVLVPALDVAWGTPRSAKAPLLRVPPALRTATRTLRVATILGSAALAVAGGPRVAFERDLRNLRAPETRSQKGVPYTRALGSRTSGVPVVLLADDARQLDAAVARLRADMGTTLFADDGEPWIRDVVSLSQYMPREQATKRAVLQRIAEQAEGALAELARGGDDHPLAPYRTHLEALERLARAAPLAREDLPDWARRPFLERDGHDDRIGLLYTRERAYDLDQVQGVRARFDELVAGTGVRGASSRFVLADLSTLVEADTRRLPPYALGAILLLIWIDLRRPGPTLACFGTLLLGLGATFGVMGLLPLPINFYNLVVMPAVIGLGIDASIHLWHARARAGPVVGATSAAALISALTTAGGFAGLWMASHPGLRSIAHLGVLATLATVTVAVALLGRPRREP